MPTYERHSSGVLDRLGVALRDLVPRYLPSGVYARDERVVLVVPQVDYDGADSQE